VNCVVDRIHRRLVHGEWLRRDVFVVHVVDRAGDGSERLLQLGVDVAVRRFRVGGGRCAIFFVFRRDVDSVVVGGSGHLHRNRDRFGGFPPRRFLREDLASDDGDDADDDDADDQQKCADDDHRGDYRLRVGSVADAAAAWNRRGGTDRRGPCSPERGRGRRPSGTCGRRRHSA